MSLQILVIDDEPAIRQLLAAALNRAGYSAEHEGDARAALNRLAKGDVDVAFCDINMPEMSGIDLVRQARTGGVDTTFIMMTAFASVDTAIEAMKAGALDYMIKPLHNEEVLHRLKQISDVRGLREENKKLRRLVEEGKPSEFSFVSPAMLEVERLVSKVAPTDSTILITGESGTGKGVAARSIHQLSRRSQGPLVQVNCGAIPENLLESEFFGHTKGAFTGADKARKGLFLEADHGTLFLDEIGELPLSLQAKLLHVLEDKQVRPVGGEQSRRVDVRIIAATNRDLTEMVQKGLFREDLFFRLSVFSIRIPPLRERKADIPGLVRHFLHRNEAHFGSKKNPVSVDPEVEDILVGNNWPGNLRELENVLERAFILSEDGRITLSDIPPEICGIDASQSLGGGRTGNLRERMLVAESQIIREVLEESQGDKKLAAKVLGISLSSLYRKLDEFAAAGIQENAATPGEPG
jgi:two-component system response regulator AtoC